MRTHRNNQLYKEERIWFFAALTLFAAVFFAYVYFLSASVVHVVMRKEIGQEIARVGSEVSHLESRYIEAQHEVSDEIATREGYVVTSEKTFVERSEATLVLSQNNDS